MDLHVLVGVRPKDVVDLSTTEPIYPSPKVETNDESPNSDQPLMIISIVASGCLLLTMIVIIIIRRRIKTCKIERKKTHRSHEDTETPLHSTTKTSLKSNISIELRQIKILLVGPTGSGKSSTGNTILDKSCFEVGMSSSGVTQQCTKETADRFNRRIEVVDTPGFSNITGTTWKTAWKHLDKPDAVLLVLDLSRFTYDIERKVKEIMANLGEDIFKIMFIVFTREDELHRHGMSIEDFVNTFPMEMIELKEKCNNRIKCINNVKHGSENIAFVEQLVEDIEFNNIEGYLYFI